MDLIPDKLQADISETLATFRRLAYQAEATLTKAQATLDRANRMIARMANEKETPLRGRHSR